VGPVLFGGRGGGGGSGSLVAWGVGEAFPAPLSGDDGTFEVVDQAVVELGLLRGLSMGDDVVMIHLLASVISQAERCLPELVASAMAEGECGWADMARLLGLSPEQAWARFAQESPVADRRPMLDVV
jgi:hypothetical protein